MHIPSLVAIHQETKEKSCINCGTDTHTDGLTHTRRKPSSRVAYPATKKRIVGSDHLSLTETQAKFPSSQNQRYDSYHHQNCLKPSHGYSKGFCEKKLSISAKMWICIAVKKSKNQTPLSYKYRYLLEYLEIRLSFKCIIRF